MFAKFKKKNTNIVGVSGDSVESHRKFKAKYGFPFMLLADVEKKLASAMGVLVENRVSRATFLIDPKGKIVKVWPKVKVAGHAEEVFASLP